MPDAKLKAVTAAIRVAERQAKLFGLDAPIVVNYRNAGNAVTVVFSEVLDVQGMSDDNVLEIDSP